MAGSTTRIADLPNLKADSHQSGTTGLGSNTYIPMNPYPNPFQTGDPPPDRPPFKLPSRDIPDTTHEFTHDPRIVANHIPPPPPDTRLVDHIREMEQTFAGDTAPVRSKAHRRAEAIGAVIHKIQMPVFIAALFFVFNTTVVTRILQLYGSFLYLFAADGSLSTRGLIIKSCIVGLVFFAIREFADEFIDTDTE